MSPFYSPGQRGGLGAHLPSGGVACLVVLVEEFLLILILIRVPYEYGIQYEVLYVLVQYRISILVYEGY